MLTTRDCDCSREAIDNWRKTVAHPRLIIIDVFGEVRQARRSRASTSSLEPLKGAAEVYYLCRKHGRYRVVKRRAFITLLGGVGGEPQLEAEILVLRQPHLM